MSELSFDHIARAFDDQGTPLHHSVYAAGQNGRSNLSRSVEPTRVFAAVVAAGMQLHQDKDVMLADQPLPENFLDAIPPEDVAARSLARVVNDSIRPSRGTSEDTTFDCSPAGIYYGACYEAELGFAAMLNYMITGNTHYDPYTHTHEIVTGQDERPILLRKAVGEQSALSLLPLTIRGVTFPAGSLIQYNLSRDYGRNDRYPETYTRHPLEKDKTRIARVEEIEQINFLRISAYAIAGGSMRHELFVDGLHGGDLLRNTDEGNVLWNLDLEQIADISSAAVENAAQPQW